MLVRRCPLIIVHFPYYFRTHEFSSNLQFTEIKSKYINNSLRTCSTTGLILWNRVWNLLGLCFDLFLDWCLRLVNCRLFFIFHLTFLGVGHSMETIVSSKGLFMKPAIAKFANYFIHNQKLYEYSKTLSIIPNICLKITYLVIWESMFWWTLPSILWQKIQKIVRHLVDEGIRNYK